MNKTLWTLFCACLLGISAAGQRNQAPIAPVQDIYAKTDPLLEGVSMEVPEKYSESSAVGLATVTSETYESDRVRKKRTTVFRILLKIQDRAGRDYYSTFSVKNYTEKRRIYGEDEVYAVRLIKPSGETVTVEVDKLDQNPNGKVAIPNLEIGDILDYGVRVVETTTGHCFAPRIQTLTYEFPVVFGFQRFRVERGFYVNFMAMNGAPAPVRNEALSDRRSWVYELKYADLEETSNEIWAPDYRTEAAEKMQICHYTTGNTKKAPLILGDPYEVKSSATDQERQRALQANYLKLLKKSKNDYTLHFSRWIRQNFWGEELPREDFMKYAYYHYRYYALIFDRETQKYRHNYLYNYIPTDFFAQMMAHAAKMKKIPHELVFVPSKYISTMEDALIIPEFNLLFRFQNDAGEWVYLETPTSYQTFDYIGDPYGGQDGYAMDSRGNFNHVTIPESKAEENLYQKVLHITPVPEGRMAEVESVSSVTGMIKYNLSQMALKNTDYHQDALKSMLPPEKDDVALNLFLQHKGKDITPEELSYETEEKLNHMYRIRSDGYDIAKYQSFELLNSGVRDASDTLKYRETFTINQFVEKVGPHYVLNLSKLSADQMAFTDKQKAERRNDVYIDFPRAYRVTYSLTIPEGYEARGLDAYNQHVDNPYGSTRMEGRVEGDRALITVTKTYKQSFIPKSAWPEVMEFLKPGEKMNYARIVLSKIES